MITPEIVTECDADWLAKDRGGLPGPVVLTYGRFETLHIGHIQHLREARTMGATLVVALSPDADAAKCELPIPDSLRAKALQHMGGINLIVLGLDLEQALERIRPDIYAPMGEDDGEGGTEAEEAACRKFGVKFRRTSVPDFLSTLGINKFLSNFGDEVLEYLKLFKTRFTLAQVEDALDAMSRLKVAVVGDTIIDEYCYCNTLGVSSKDPILALRYRNEDTFAGGIVAVANHVANFTGKVSLFSVLGDHDSYKEFIEGKLNPGITAHFAIQENAPTVRKRRYIEGYTQNKLFEIYFMEDAGLCEERDERFRQAVAEALPEHDLVIVADFGHGAVSPAMRRLLEDKAQFLAVNAQANSGNRGFHTVTKYTRADYVSIAEHEMRLEMRDTRASVPAMIDILAPRLSCRDFVVTRGKRGSTIRCADGRHISVPAFANRIVDRIGAGDAFLSVTSLAACLAMEPELICFIGNIVGALAVEILGNQKSIDKVSVKRHAASLLG